MKIRALVISLLVIILCVMGYFLVDLKNRNVKLQKKYDELKDIVAQNELDKEVYFKKENELNELKEKNKDKMSKYDEVEKWNQEIKEYLD